MLTSARSTSVALDPLLRLEDVAASHDGRAALTGIRLDLRPGTQTVLAGTNGSGKSTLLAVIAGTHPPSTGLVTRRAGVSVAFVVQHSAVTPRLPLTVRDAVAMGRWRMRGAWRPLRLVDHRVIDECLIALDVADLADRPLGALSGGQRQRVLVAQGLAQEADLLLLDEPAAGVDGRAGALIDEAVESELARGACVVQATHDLALVERASRKGSGSTVVRLAGGRRVG